MGSVLENTILIKINYRTTPDVVYLNPGPLSLAKVELSPVLSHPIPHSIQALRKIDGFAWQTRDRDIQFCIISILMIGNSMPINYLT